MDVGTIKPSVSIQNTSLLLHRSFKIGSLMVQQSGPSFPIYHTATRRIVPSLATTKTTTANFHCCCTKENQVDTITSSDTGVWKQYDLKLQTQLIWMPFLGEIKGVFLAIKKLIPVWIVVSFILNVEKLKLRDGSKKKEPRKNTFDDLVGVDATISEFRYILQRLQKSHGSHVLTPTGVLLWGPPGTGKSTLVHALAREAEVSFLPVAGEDLLRDEKGIGKLNGIFNEARQNAPSIIFIDGVEAVKAVKKLIEQIDKCASDGTIVLVVATVEKLHLVDERLMGCMSTMIELKKPNLQSRQEMANVIIQKQETEVPEGEKETIVKYIASEMDGFVWKHISLVCYEAKLRAMSRGAGVPMTLEDVREYIQIFKRNRSLREEKVREAKEEDDKIKRAKALEFFREYLDGTVLETTHKNQN